MVRDGGGDGGVATAGGGAESLLGEEGGAGESGSVVGEGVALWRRSGRGWRLWLRWFWPGGTAACRSGDVLEFAAAEDPDWLPLPIQRRDRLCDHEHLYR